MPRHSSASRRELLAQWARSGLAASDFAAACGLSAATLYRWRRDTAPAFIEVAEPGSVPPIAGAAPTSGASIELALPCGATVRVAPGFDAATLRRVVEALS